MLVSTAIGALVHAFVTFRFLRGVRRQQFQLRAAHFYRVAALWGAHEGSLLLWAWMLAAWTLAVAVASRHLPASFASRVMGVLGFVSFGFLLFTSPPRIPSSACCRRQRMAAT